MNGFRLISVWQVPLLVIWVTNVGGGGWFIVKLCVSGASAGHLGGMGRGIGSLSSSLSNDSAELVIRVGGWFVVELSV